MRLALPSIRSICAQLTLMLLATRAYSDELTLREGLSIGSSGRPSRTAFHTDLIEQALVLGTWQPPHEGEAIIRPDGTNRTWNKVVANAEGTFTNRELRGGYLYSPVVMEAPEVRVLEASGHNMVYVNGEPRAGDPYSNGNLEVPVALRAGTNDFLFNVGRGRLNAKLVTPKAPVYLSTRDSTLPDLVVGSGPSWGAVPVINATTQAVSDLVLSTSSSRTTVDTPLLPIAPMTVRKVQFRIPPESLPKTNSVPFTLTLRRAGGGDLDTASISLRVRQKTDHYKLTFRSEIDGSIQYYAVVPPNPLPPEQDAPALFLSTHGAGVEAMGQADAYAAKPWGYLVAPTNRRPYGFDWEDWGRMDALEVLELAQSRFHTDPAQTYLTGHSMGGHGAWQLGVTFPGRFAAVAPSAGWISFFSYAGAAARETSSPIEAIIERARNPSDTLALATNYLQEAIYILHGDQDDNVPLSEARHMKERLSELHHDFLYHEQPGAGHWWGNACVDWPPIFNLFSHHKIPTDNALTHIRFSTANPGVSSSNHWVAIEAQEKCLNRSSVDISYDAGARKFTGATENLGRLTIRPQTFRLTGEIALELDGDRVDVPASASGDVHLERRNNHWTAGEPFRSTDKNPRRYGPFKEAFNHRMIFVYATGGTAAENAWAYAKARYDAEAWLYRGNGSVDVMQDADFDPATEHDRSVILYGNSESSRAWPALLNNSPVQVTRHSVMIGGREVRGDDLACLFLRPRAGSALASVAVISGTGLAGSRLTERVPYFLAGVAFPDCTVFGSDTLQDESKGVRVAGFFGNDWSVEHGEFAWRE